MSIWTKLFRKERPQTQTQFRIVPNDLPHRPGLFAIRFECGQCGKSVQVPVTSIMGSGAHVRCHPCGNILSTTTILHHQRQLKITSGAGKVFHCFIVSLVVCNPLRLPLRRSGVFGAVRRQRRSGAEGAGGRAGFSRRPFLFLSRGARAGFRR